MILPQLAAPGVAAHRVKELSGFRVMYGPVQAADLGRYVNGGFKATPEMRRKNFSALERTILVPVELMKALKSGAITLPIAFLVAGLVGPKGFWSNAVTYGAFAGCAILFSIVAGAIVTPILLPWLPGRAFALKGVVPGIVAMVILVVIRAYVLGSRPDHIEMGSWLFLITGLTTHLSMNFTGASTYTSLSGVRKEMRWALPCQIASVSTGVVLWLLALLNV